LNPYDIGPIIKRIVGKVPGVTDIIFSPGNVPKALMDGNLKEIPLKDLRTFTEYQTEILGLSLLRHRPGALKTFKHTGLATLSYSVESLAHFRVQVFRQRNSISVIMRAIPCHLPTFESLGLPKTFVELTGLNHGLVLFAGPVGSGKTRSMAATLNYLTQTYSFHMITLEDPIELYFGNTPSLVHQREVGLDTADLTQGIREICHLSPQIMVVGELTEPSNMEAAVAAAESGILVFATLNATDAACVIDRFSSSVEPEKAKGQRARLASVLRFVVSQRLLPRATGIGRVPAVEFLRVNEVVATMIREGDCSRQRLVGVLNAATAEGMTSFSNEARRLVQVGVVDGETAFRILGQYQVPTIAPKEPEARNQQAPMLELDNSLSLDINP